MDTRDTKHFQMIGIVAVIGVILTIAGGLLVIQMMSSEDPMFKSYFWLDIMCILNYVLIFIFIVVIEVSDWSKSFWSTIHVLIVVGIGTISVCLFFREIMTKELFYLLFLPRLTLGVCLLLNIVIAAKTIFHEL